MKKFGSLQKIQEATDYEILKTVKNINKNKISKLRATFGIARLIESEVLPSPYVINGPEDIANLLRAEFRGVRKEQLFVVYMDGLRQLIGFEMLMEGTQESIHPNIRDILASAIEKRAFFVAVAHNHPSGNPTPSKSDIEFTDKLMRAGEVVGIHVIDHVVFGTKTRSREDDYESVRLYKKFDLDGL